MLSNIIRARLLVGTALLCVPAIAQAGHVVGTVSDITGTRTLPSAQISIVELGRTVEADRAGRYRFTDVPAGTYTLRAIYTGAERVDTSITVAQDGDLVQNVLLGGANDILVNGQRANLASSLSRQRGADGVESVLTRDSIGQFPDQNVAESVRRAPGVNVLNDQGEGRFIAVRGLDPSLNAASLNGVRVPAPEADTRSVALDVVASELIESIEIKKSLTPDMDGDTIGASVEINTTSAFDRKKDLLAASLEGSYNHYSGDLTPKGSVSFSNRIADNFGVSGGASYYLRKFETDNVEMDGWNTDDAGNGFADTVEYRDYDVRRLRTGGSLSFDWQPAESTRLYARGIYNRFSDQEDRRRLIFEMDEDPASSTGASATFDSADGQIRVERDLKDRFEKQTIQSYTVGGETNSGPWKLVYSAAWSRASELEEGSIDPITFRRDFNGEDGDDLTVGFDYSNYLIPGFTVGGASVADFNDASAYAFDSLDRTTLSRATDKEWTFRADVTRSFALAEGTFDLQFGGKARLRKKAYDLNVDTLEYDGDFTLADVVGAQTYRLADLGPVVAKKGQRGFLQNNIGDFEIDELGSAFASVAEDFSVDEDIYAGYLLGRYQAGPLRLIGGVRMEHTKNDIRGNTVTLNEDGEDGEQLIVAPNSIRRSYTDWLPSALLRYEASRDVVLRAGVFRSLVRPGIGQLAPRFAIERDGDDLEGAFGNPDLTPYRAWNVDVGAEWYFAKSSVLQLGFFYKDIDDYITTVTFEADDAPFNGLYRGIAFTEADIPLNMGKAKIKGIEFAYSQVYSMLPAPFDGLLTNVNYTFTDADGQTFDGDTGGLRDIPLPASSRHTFNVVLGYEKGPVSVRLAGTYRDKYLDEVQAVADEDRYVRQHFQLDASARYRITPNIQVFGEWVNINNAKYVAYQNAPTTRRLLQYEKYSYTMKFGVRANF
ncbi:Vitamin B12 transporter BtuB [Sphingobium sp. AntQ-1]|uniref:TonB-dependent receptor n=1 Tax=Sphingobium sp. AntQ-1 TaxID=2930091 RepID=UPI00234EB4DA|nr:TonB-dependent receptor [Sphingobium sp. AntQ-1]WCP13773.1 Vitamin B12 transporter BtuB [Sphingobium sp. AntQ-1]